MKLTNVGRGGQLVARFALPLTLILLVAGLTCLWFAWPHKTDVPRVSADPGVTSSFSPITGTGSVVDAKPLGRSVPVNLSIKSINLTGIVTPTGLDKSGSLQVSLPGSHYDDIGWYKNFPTPGEIGPAVLIGHVDSAAAGPSVFYNLRSVPIGALISVGRADGSIAVFQVDGVATFEKAAFPTKLVYGKTKVAALRLITCGGSFDHKTGHYLDNIVVFATLVSSA